jgi:16S rRNA (guanine527-N7)-methyltransferase
LSQADGLSQPDGAASAAREVRRWLEQLLDANPSVRDALPAEFAERAQAYAALLLRANQRLNLTRITEPYEVARLHLLDAVAGLPWLDASGADVALDLGSGGGLPGIPLALARPDVRWTLVDSVRKKAAVLSGFAEALGLRSMTVVAERAEVLGRTPEHRERYGFVGARACAALPVLVELALPLVAIDGSLVAWKGHLSDDDDELRRGRAAAVQLGAGRIVVQPAGPEVLGGHTFVVVAKDLATPARYPRRPGEPARRPVA